MDDFATYILNEKDYIQKMIITYYLSKKTGIFFDKSIVLKTELTKLFIDYKKIDVDKNLVLTVSLLCNCKKIDDAQKIGKLETFAKEGAEYLSTLGFDKRFCKICEELNRYSESEPREKESDIIEVVDQFTGLILNRVERFAYPTDEAITILKERNFKDYENRYLEEFISFILDIDRICIREKIDVPILKKLVYLHNNEANVRAFITVLGNTYARKIDELLCGNTKEAKTVEFKEEDIKVIEEKPERALFSKEIAEKVLNHESLFKLDEE